MKKVIFTAAFFVVAALATTAVAQEDSKQKNKGKKESQEIIIKRKGDVDVKLSVEIKDDKITINGKPLAEFKDDNVTINRRNITIWDGEGNKRFDFSPDMFNGMTWNSDDAEPKAFLGVTTVPNTPGGPETDSKGAEISNVSEKSPAEKAELKAGDIITKINDKKVTDPESLSDIVGSFKPKEEVTVYYKRDGKEKSSRIVLGERKQTFSYSFSTPGTDLHSYSFPRTPGTPNPPGGLNDLAELESMNRVFGSDNGHGYVFGRTQKLGIKIQDTEESNGVKILSVDKDSPAEKAGLKTGDVLTEVGGKKVTNTDEARDELQSNAGKNAYNLKAKRDNREMNFDITIPKKLKTANL